jgi:putative sigma-54 modulation protein
MAQIIVHGTDFPVTDAIRSYVDRKLGKLERFFQRIQKIEVFLRLDRSQHKPQQVVEATVWGDGLIVRAEERADDIYAAIDLAHDTLERQLKKFRGKQIARRRRMEKLSQGLKELMEVKPKEGEEEEKEIPEIIRLKRFPAKPMSPEEAALQMELLGHDFFIFVNAESGLPSVIYRRKDGNLGLIELETQE